MKLKHSFLILLAICIFKISNAQQEFATTNTILQNGFARAELENKKVFVMFHASWCIWCHKMDSSMNDLSCKKMFDDNFVTIHLTVDESKEKKNLETPGAEAFRAKYHGEQAGLPFWLILDKNRILLADSKMRSSGTGPDAPGENIGCPASTEEVAYFIKILKVTTNLNDNELRVIQERFRKNN